MMQALAAPSSSPCADDARAALVAAAIVTRDARLATLVVIPRQPEAVARARAVARRLGVGVTAEVSANGIEIHFVPTPSTLTERRPAESAVNAAHLAGPPGAVTEARVASPWTSVVARCVAPVSRLTRCLRAREQIQWSGR